MPDPPGMPGAPGLSGEGGGVSSYSTISTRPRSISCCHLSLGSASSAARDAELLQQRRLIDALSKDLLFDLRRHRLAVHLRRKSEEVLRVGGGNREIGVLRRKGDVRHRKGDQVGHVLVALVEEVIGDPNLRRRYEQLLGGHLDVRILDEDQSPGGEFR